MFSHAELALRAATDNGSVVRFPWSTVVETAKRGDLDGAFKLLQTAPPLEPHHYKISDIIYDLAEHFARQRHREGMEELLRIARLSAVYGAIKYDPDRTMQWLIHTCRIDAKSAMMDTIQGEMLLNADCKTLELFAKAGVRLDIRDLVTLLDSQLPADDNCFSFEKLIDM